MRFFMLIHESREDLDGHEALENNEYFAAWRAYYKALVDANVYVTGAPLKPAATATTLRWSEGRRHVQNGPFAEAKEELGGFMILELPSLDAALEWAARCPSAMRGALDIRPVDPDFLDAVARP